MRRSFWFLILVVAVSVFVFQLTAYARPGPGKKDRDNNPPGPKGGAGTNWENPPGPKGGPGASPDRMKRPDRDNNPPGPVGGAGTNWENPAGPKGGPGASPDARPWNGNPPVIAGGSETVQSGSQVGAVDSELKEKAIVDKNWEKAADTNKDGIVDSFEIKQWRDRKRDGHNPPGPKGGPGTDWKNPPGPKGGKGASPR